MPTEALNQLRVLRENIAQQLRSDPRYLTLAALDKSIAEISEVLGAAPEAAAPLAFESSKGPDHAAAGSGPQTMKSMVDPVVAPDAGRMGRTAPHVQTPEREDEGDGDDSEPAPGAASTDTSAASTDTSAASEETDAASEETAPAGDETTSADAGPGSAEDDTSHAGDEAGHADDEAIVPEGRAGGYVPMRAQDGAAQYQPSMSIKFGRLPGKVDLRPLMPPVEDQGEVSCCVASAVAAAYDYAARKTSRKDASTSRLFVYYNARWRDGAEAADEGSVIQLAIEGMKTFGACDDAAWPFAAEAVARRPSAEAYKGAAAAKVQDMALVPLRLETWKQALAEGRPIVFGCLLFETFDDCTRNGGVVPMPAPGDFGREAHGGHAMCAVGYCESEKVFIVRNSWGPAWGDKGYCYMPYSYLLNPKFNDGDCWVLVTKGTSQSPREAWSDDATPVTNGGRGVDFSIAPYTVEQYASLPVDLFEPTRQPFNTAVGEDFAHFATLATLNRWSEMDAFDARAFRASNAAMAGVSSALADFSDEDWARADEDHADGHRD